MLGDFDRGTATTSIAYSVILPAYREEANLRVLLPKIVGVMKTIATSYEIIVVDTVSALDATADVCRDWGVRYVNRLPTNSFGDAVRTGIREARGCRILFMDADGSHTPEFIPKLITHAAEYDIVVASRYVDGGDTENNHALVWMSKLLNFSYRLVLNLRCKDVSNSFKVYRAEHLKTLRLRCKNFDVIQEILVKIARRKKGIRIIEVPFFFKKRLFGETKRKLAWFILTYVLTMLKLRLMS